MSTQQEHSLSIDTVFLVMEFLPPRNAINSLLVCKDWFSLNYYEIFWKQIYHRYVISELCDKYDEMFKFLGSLEFSLLDVKQILMGNELSSIREKQEIIKKIKGIKLRTVQKNQIHIVVCRAMLMSLVTTFENHILKDRTLNREFVKLEKESRFKYLMQKQVVSEKGILYSSFYSLLCSNSISLLQDLVKHFVEYVMGEEYMRIHLNFTMIIGLPQRIVQEKMFHQVLQSTETDSKYWDKLVEVSLQYLPKLIPKSELGTVLKKIFESQLYRAKLSWFGSICYEYDFYEEKIELVIELFKTKGIHSSETVDPSEFITRIRDNSLDFMKKSKYIIKYISLLENFKSKEELYKIFTSDYLFNSFLSMLTKETDSSNLIYFLDNSPIPLDMLDIGFGLAGSMGLKIMKYSKEKGYLFPQSKIEKYLNQNVHSDQIFDIIKFLIDNYPTDIYDIDSRVRIFPYFLSNLSMRFAPLETIDEILKIFFSDTPIDLDRLTSDIPKVNKFTYNIFTNEKRAKEFIQYCKKRFVQNVFNLPTLCYLLSFTFVRAPLKKILYEETMYNEDLKLSGYVNQLMESKPELFQETSSNFYDYKPADPKYIIAIYLRCNL